MNNIQSVFILGNPRSGTSLFRIMLNAHPEIVAPPECGFAHWWLEKYEDWKKSDIKTNRLNEFLNDLFNSTKIETWNLKREKVKDLIFSKSPDSYGDLVTCVYLSYPLLVKKNKIVCDKNNYYINHISELTNIWPNAKYIHLVRDGRDVACSYKEIHNLNTTSVYKPKLTTSIKEIATEWVDNNRAIQGLEKKYPDRYCLVKFENLILSPRETLQNTCDYLGILFSEQMLEYYRLDENNQEPKETLDWKLKTKEKPDSQRINRYENILGEEEIRIFNSVASNQLDYYGYKI